MPAPDRSSPTEVFAAALRLGLTSFGGPVAHIGYFRRMYVERLGWVDEARFADLLALSQALPGPASSQLGLAIGTIRAGRLGGVLAWIGFTAPSVIALVAFALLTTTVDLTDAGWVHGLKLAAVAIVAQAVLAMWRSLAPDLAGSAVVVGAAALALALPSPITQVGIIAAGALAGLVLPLPDPNPPAPAPAVPGRRDGMAFLALFAVLLVGLPLARAVIESQPLDVVETFYRTGSLVFGGGHVVLPLLHESVVTPGWVTEDRFLAGYGAAQAVPGPLFSFSAYLGAVMTPSPNGVPGALLAVTVIFLPSFLLVWGVLPFWDAIRARPRARRALVGVNAAVVGLLVAALITPVWTSAVRAPVDAAIALTGAALLMTLRVPPWAIVVLAAVAGEAVARL